MKCIYCGKETTRIPNICKECTKEQFDGNDAVVELDENWNIKK